LTDSDSCLCGSACVRRLCTWLLPIDRFNDRLRRSGQSVSFIQSKNTLLKLVRNSNSKKCARLEFVNVISVTFTESFRKWSNKRTTILCGYFAQLKSKNLTNNTFKTVRKFESSNTNRIVKGAKSTHPTNQRTTGEFYHSKNIIDLLTFSIFKNYWTYFHWWTNDCVEWEKKRKVWTLRIPLKKREICNLNNKPKQLFGEEEFWIYWHRKDIIHESNGEIIANLHRGKILISHRLHFGLTFYSHQSLKEKTTLKIDLLGFVRSNVKISITLYSYKQKERLGICSKTHSKRFTLLFYLTNWA